MNSPRYRNPHSASRESLAALRAFRLDGLPALAHAQGFPPELTVRARWDGRTQSSSIATARSRRSFWLPRIAGLLAFGALAFGIFVAARDTCTRREPAAGGSYSRSTLAPITASDTASTSPRDGGCKRSPGGFGQSKTRSVSPGGRSDGFSGAGSLAPCCL